LKVEGNVLYVKGLDAINGTPVLDIKPYMKDLEEKEKENTK
jgi:tRNA (Thr-GGU) A37 N-methylase